jgi:septal ring factor EnvC (AmiA/AmiB activator)
MENHSEHSNPPGDKSTQTKKLKESIKSLEKELNDIQESCQHSEYKIANCPKENSGFSLKRVCKVCEKEIGYPSQEEIDNWATS